MWEVARSRNLLSGFVMTLKRLFESVVGTLFCLLLYIQSRRKRSSNISKIYLAHNKCSRDLTVPQEEEAVMCLVHFPGVMVPTGQCVNQVWRNTFSYFQKMVQVQLVQVCRAL